MGIRGTAVRRKTAGAGHWSSAAPSQAAGFGANEYNVRTGIDVEAKGPDGAMLAAIQEIGIRNPEAFCFHVEHLQSGRKWEVELHPSGEIEIDERGE